MATTRQGDRGESVAHFRGSGTTFVLTRDGFRTLVQWLNMPAEMFWARADRERGTQPEPDLVTQIAPLLRARHDLDKRDIDYLEEVIRATLRHVQAAREGSE